MTYKLPMHLLLKWTFIINIFLISLIVLLQFTNVYFLDVRWFVIIGVLGLLTLATRNIVRYTSGKSNYFDYVIAFQVTGVFSLLLFSALSVFLYKINPGMLYHSDFGQFSNFAITPMRGGIAFFLEGLLGVSFFSYFVVTFLKKMILLYRSKVYVQD